MLTNHFTVSRNTNNHKTAVVFAFCLTIRFPYVPGFLHTKGLGKKRKFRRFRRKSRNLSFLTFPKRKLVGFSSACAYPGYIFGFRQLGPHISPQSRGYVNMCGSVSEDNVVSGPPEHDRLFSQGRNDTSSRFTSYSGQDGPDVH